MMQLALRAEPISIFPVMKYGLYIPNVIVSSIYKVISNILTVAIIVVLHDNAVRGKWVL